MEEFCTWKSWDKITYGSGTYDTACGNAQYFNDGDINENSYRFCPYCGKKIKEIEDGDDDQT